MKIHIKNIVPFCVFFLLALIVISPLFGQFTGSMLGLEGDVYNYVWNVDTFWKEIRAGNNPFVTQHIFYPRGTTLLLHTYAPLVSVFGFFFRSQIILYLNILIFGSLVLSGVCTYLVITTLTRSKTAGLWAGSIYMLSPILMSFIESQHIYFLFSAPFFPLAIFLLYKYLYQQKPTYIYIVMSLTWIVFFIDYYSTILYIGLVASIILIFAIKHLVILRRKIEATTCILFGKAIILCGFLPLLFFFIMIPDKGSLRQAFGGGENSYPLLCSANVAKYITPPEGSLFFSSISRYFSTLFLLEHNYDTPSYFVGFTVLILFIISFQQLRKMQFFWEIFLTTFLLFLFTLGPVVKVGPTSIEIGIPTFFSLISSIPFLQFIDCPQRFTVGVQSMLSILAGFGLATLLTTSTGIRRYILYLLALLAIIEFLQVSLPMHPLRVPAVYSTIQKDAGNGTVLELPSGISESKGAFGYDWSISALHTKQLYWQTIHAKPRIGGYTSRLSQDTYEYYYLEPILSDLFYMTSLDGNWTGAQFSDDQIQTFIQKFSLRYIILSPNERQRSFEVVIEEIFHDYISLKEIEEGFILYTITLAN